MDKTALVAMLADTFRDLRLDNHEKQKLREVLQGLRPEDKRFVRNRAFELARDSALTGPAAALEVVKWLEQICRALEAPPAEEPIPSSAHFSPGDACRNTVINLLRHASTHVEICVFTLSDDRIAEAVLQCHQRGVAVRVVTDNDKANDEGSDVRFLRREGVPLRMDHNEFHMHHKFALFDRRILVSGSFNWTRSASEVNHENILVTGDPVLVREFAQRFELLWKRYG